jgi:Domain of unknown function (DUF5050)
MRKVIIPALLALAVPFVGLVTAVAFGAPNKPAVTFIDPSPSEGATLTTSSVQFAFTYNRTPTQTHSLVCSLSGPTSSSGPCDAPVASGTGSQSGKSYSGLANGSYTFSVTLKANGGMASATRHFNIDVSVGRHLYWANFGAGTIGRASVDGTGANQNFISGASGPDGVAVDSGHVYWANDNSTTIGRANLDGTGVNQNFISGAFFPVGVAVDANYVYWSNPQPGSATVGRANLDGTGANQNFIAGGFPEGVAVDANYVYWTNDGSGTIGRANLDGSNPNQSFITGVGDSFEVAVDANHVYWVDFSSNTIGRANLDGTGANQSFITGSSVVGGVAVDANYVYWSNPGTNAIGRANLDGSNPNQSFITGVSAGFMAVDAG